MGRSKRPTSGPTSGPTSEPPATPTDACGDIFDVIVDKAIYLDGVRQGCGDPSVELERLRERGEGFLWIGVKDPTDAEFAEINDELRLHPLAVEDAVRGNQRPKIDFYDESMFVVLKTLHYIEETSDVETGAFPDEAHSYRS